jgi:ankyrin repeat protein
VGGGKFESQDGDTALMRAAYSVNADCARLLIDAGADKEAKNKVRRLSLLTCGILSRTVPLFHLFYSNARCLFILLIFSSHVFFLS